MEKNNMQENTALLVMDVQNAIVGMMENEDKDMLMNSLASSIEMAHERKIPVIYVVVGFRKGYPGISSNNKSFGQIKSSGRNLDHKQARTVHEAVAPQPDDIVVTKRRISAFTGSDLEVMLRSLGIRHLLLTGIATSGVVLSTVREAADKDYRLTVISDCCADRDEEVHRVLMTKVFPRQADVFDSQKVRDLLQST